MEVDVHPEPHPEPGCELACGVRAPVGGVISTSWKTPLRGSETTTNAGELLRDPLAQLGRQLRQVNVPLPSPALLPQVDHVTADMVMSPAQPMSMDFGRTWGFCPGWHDTTVGALAAGAMGGDTVPVVEWDGTEATEAFVTTLTADVEGPGELMANPTAKPMPRAATTTAATPARTAVLRRIVIICTSRCAKEGDRVRGAARHLGFPLRWWGYANLGPFALPGLGGFGDLGCFAWDRRLRGLRGDALNSRPIRNLALTPRPAQCRQWSSSWGEGAKRSSLETSSSWSEASMTRHSRA
jgi:hypothetical protein